MGIFDKILGNWVKIVDIFSNVTIEDFEYRTGVLSELVENHCTKCVAVNHCWFKKEKGKKPESFDYSNIKLIDAMMKGLIPGLYHYKCHCKEKPIIVSSLSEIELIYSNDKIMYLFKDKGAWIESMGFHTEEDYDYFVETLLEKTK
ncbi:MAG: hypothetical protein IJT25_02500, partial [Clostridia bacterium]|nr:hypothetical protein [Clostridia bacterium]